MFWTKHHRHFVVLGEHIMVFLKVVVCVNSIKDLYCGLVPILKLKELKFASYHEQVAFRKCSNPLQILIFCASAAS